MAISSARLSIIPLMQTEKMRVALKTLDTIYEILPVCPFWRRRASSGTVRLEKDGLMQTITNTLPVRVTDSVTLADAIAAAGGGSAPAGNTIDVQVIVNTGVPKVDKAALTKASTMGDIKALANAILEAINGAPGAEEG